MHALVVNAHGEPGSFARRVQEDPRLAVDLLRLLERLREWDQLATTSDGPYWLREINAAIAKATGDDR